MVANVKAAQVRQLRSDQGAGGLLIRLLGPITILHDGKPVTVAAKKARALVGYLSLREGSIAVRHNLGPVALTLSGETGKVWTDVPTSATDSPYRWTRVALDKALGGTGLYAGRGRR